MSSIKRDVKKKDLPRPESRLFLEIQPTLHLPCGSSFAFVILISLRAAGGDGEYVLKDHTWRWLALFVPLSIGMFVAQRSLFPTSAHLEWPGRAARNPWAQAFFWIRQNTPPDAVFALEPDYMRVSGEDGSDSAAWPSAVVWPTPSRTTE